MIAAAVGHRIAQSTRRLASFPRSGRIVPEFKLTNVREVIIQSHRVIYEVAGDRIHILTVIHGARQLERPVISGRRSDD